MLKGLTDKFREKDVQKKGVINIHYEEVWTWHAALSLISLHLSEKQISKF